MRALVVGTVLLVPAFAAANPCEELARAVCPSKDEVGECLLFVDDALRAPPERRLDACRMVLGDQPTLEDYRARMKAKSAAQWFPIEVRVEGKKADGSAWDAKAGAPDLAVCLEIDGAEVGCLPDGGDRDSITRAECRDATRCMFNVRAWRGARIAVDVVDLDEATAEMVGVCAFIAGDTAGQCTGPVALVTEASPGVGSLERRLVGRWEMDIERTMLRDAGFAGLSVEQRAKVIATMAEALRGSYFEFGADGRFSVKMREVSGAGRYAVTGLKGETLSLAVTAPGEAAKTMEVTVVERGVVLRDGGKVMVLRRAP